MKRPVGRPPGSGRIQLPELCSILVHLWLGYTHRDIGRMHGCSGSYIAQIAVRYGLTRREPYKDQSTWRYHICRNIPLQSLSH